MALIFKNIKHHFKSLTFIIFVLVVVVFFISQFHGSTVDVLAPPEPNQNYYGSTTDISEAEEMLHGYSTIDHALYAKELGSYPIGIYKGIKLTSEDLQLLKDFLNDMTGNSTDIIKENIVMDYDTYRQFLRDFDQRLGGNTILGKFYHPARRLTYEEALLEYDTLMKDDFSNAYSRYASDYLGITAALFIPFLSAFLLIKDKKAQTEDLIFSTPINPFKYIFSKFIALFVSVSLVYLTIALFETVLFSVLSNNYDVSFNVLSFLNHIVLWILPTVSMVIALPMLLSLIFSNGIVSMVIQIVLSYSLLMVTPLSGPSAWWHLFIRFNTIGEEAHYQSLADGILLNRLFIFALSLCLVGITGFLWQLKRDRLYTRGGKHEHNNSTSS